MITERFKSLRDLFFGCRFTDIFLAMNNFSSRENFKKKPLKVQSTSDFPPEITSGVEDLGTPGQNHLHRHNKKKKFYKIQFIRNDYRSPSLAVGNNWLVYIV